MKKRTVIWLGLTLILTFSCKTKQVITKEKITTNSTIEIIEKVKKNEPAFKTANVNKMNLALKLNDRSFNVNANCKIVTDSSIHVSIQPILGIELFRAEFTKDSVWIYDKMNRRYYSTDYAYFDSKFGINVDFYSLQALISNRFFTINKNENSLFDIALQKSNTGLPVLEYETAKIKQRITILPSNRIEQIDINSKSSNSIFKTSYFEFINFEGITFPQKIDILVLNQKNKFSCNFSIIKAVFNSIVVLTPTDKTRFDKGNLEQLLRK